MDSSPADNDPGLAAELDPDAIADPSTAENSAEPKSMLDAVTAALEGDGGKEEAATSTPDKAEAEAPKAEAEKAVVAKVDPDELSEADMKRLSQAAQKRIRNLVSDRKKADAELATLKPKAEQLDNITTQIRQTGLDQKDLSVIFDVGTALKKGDFFGARKILEPIFVQVMHATGGVLPEDLRKDVELGQMPAERARELATARAAANQAAFQGRQTQERRMADEAQQLTAGVVNSVNEWEKAKAASDPDWKLKAPEIMRSLRLSLLEGTKPKSVADAIKMAEDALTEVNERVRAYRPAPRAVKAVVSGGGASPRNSAAPKSMLEAIEAVL